MSEYCKFVNLNQSLVAVVFGFNSAFLTSDLERTSILRRLSEISSM